MLNIGIVGASGYVGQELNRILSKHPDVCVGSLSARRARPALGIKKFNIKKIVSSCDLVFFALPHAESMKFVPLVLRAKKKVIDLGADYRLKNTGEFTTWYAIKHSDKNNVVSSVYGLPAVYAKQIKKASLVANPGCYPTAAILSLLPLIKKKIIDTNSIIIDAKSGFSGAGRKNVEDGLLDELKENFKPYKVNYHQHMPEINQELSKYSGKRISVNFVPHLLPVFRGLMTTTYVKIVKAKSNISDAKLTELYKKFYKNDPFLRIRSQNSSVQIKDVVETNFCDIAIYLRKESKMIVVVSVIDNLVKGAAGQAVENMNLMYGFKQTEGLL
ncbi:MAG TPA: N-acetyl-gamma-glutamyl-phosphate reductase [Candidatus Omnitrophica bacterium]|nr:N-acetyl-gamma-glutamyl-phosphate reductase [Candidatus Omnitrophota bacterium]